MNFIDLLVELNESRFEKERGSKSGRDKAKKGKKVYNPQKSKVHVYKTIKDATDAGKYGEVFSTDGSDRLYVTTKPTWGKKSTDGGEKYVAKGFTPGSSTPGSSFNSIKSYAKRTKKKHGGSKAGENQ